MSIRAILVVLLAIVCGGSAAIGVNQLRGNGGPSVEANIETAPVVVAATNIARGQMVASGDVRICQWPKKLVPEGALANADDAAGRAACVAIIPGEPVFNAKLAAKDSGRGLAALVPKGMRAYTIQASKVACNVAGFVLPGNKVDILLNLRGSQDDATGGATTTTLLQSVEILAVDQRLDAPAENKVSVKDLGSVTLLVTPEQAALLDLGQNAGQLTLSLRNPEDTDSAKTEPAKLADIRFRQEKPVEPPKPEAVLPTLPPETQPVEQPKPLLIVTLRGNNRGEIKVPANR